MHPLRCLLFALTGLFVRPGTAQTFDVEQFEQLFRPRIKVDLRHQAATAFSDTSGNFANSEGNAVFTVPIHSHFSTDLSLDTAAHGLVELLKGSVRVRASQVLCTVRLGARQVELGFDETPIKRSYIAGLGLLGMKLTKKYRVLFWSVDAYLSEENQTLDQVVPRFNGLIGKMRIKGLRRSFFYGLALSCTDRLVLPVPFVGGNLPLGGDWSFQYLLPAQVAIGLKPSSRTKFMGGLALDGFRGGMEWHAQRTNLTCASVRTFVHVRRSAGKHFQFRADAGYSLTSSARFARTDIEPYRYAIEPGPYFGIGINVLLGRSVLEHIIDGMVR